MNYTEAMEKAVSGSKVYRESFYPITVIYLPDDEESLRLAGFFVKQDNGDEMTSYIPADMDIEAEDWKQS